MTPSDESLPADAFFDDEEEAVDGEPVLDGDQTPPSQPASLAAVASSAIVPAASPAVQAAAAAATGFVAGAATLAIARRHGARKLTRSSARRRAGDALPILGTRSFLIDIHMLRPHG